MARSRRFLLQRSLTVLLLFSCIAAGPVCAQSMTNALYEPGRGELLLNTGSLRQPALQLGSRVDIQVSGMVARVTVEQRFFNTQPDWADGSYVFPLPATAAVAEMRIEVDGRVIVGEIREKEAAEKVFKQARAAGKRAALLDQSRPNLFRTRVANLGPRQEISVTLTYLEKVRYDTGEFSLRFPMTITERFDPNAAHSAIDERPPAEPDRAEPDFAPPGARTNPVQITARIDAGMALDGVSSPYHWIITRQDGNVHEVALASQVVQMDRDFVLRWWPTPSQAPQAALFAEHVDGDTYALLMVMPPAGLVQNTRLAREVIFVVDRSGSMGGVSIEAARRALASALMALAPTDKFNIISFDDDTRQLFHTAQLADGGYLQNGRQFIERLEAGGGTVMKPALQAALDQQDELPAGTVRQVIFITDGAVWNDAELLRYIDRKLGPSRLFTVGIGSAPNNHFMTKAAQFGRGTFTAIAVPGEAEVKMKTLFRKLEAPVLAGLSVGWSDQAEVFPERVPDLYLGEPLVVTARLPGTRAPLIAGIRDANDQWQENLRLDTPGQHAGVATLWARDKLEALYDRITTTGNEASARPAIVELGLRHKLVSRFTSFVAVEQTPVRPMGAQAQQHNVASLMPAGQVIGLPQSDAGTFMRLMTGLLSLLGTWLVWGRAAWRARTMRWLRWRS